MSFFEIAKRAWELPEGEPLHVTHAEFLVLQLDRLRLRPDEPETPPYPHTWTFLNHPVIVSD